MQLYRILTISTGLAGLLLAGTARAVPVGTAFSYQGFLEKPAGTPLTDTCTFEMALCDDPAAACVPGTVSNHPGITVSEGVFTVPDVDFGAGSITGEARWMEVSVQCTGDASPVVLSPRVELKPAPYAFRSVDGVGPVSGVNVSSTGNVAMGAPSFLTARLLVQENSAETGNRAGVVVQQAGTGDATISLVIFGTVEYAMGIDRSDGNKFKISDFSFVGDYGIKDRITIDTTGRVGVGISSPAERLDVAGNIHASGAIRTGNSIIIDGNAHTITSDVDFEVHVADGRALRLETNATSPNVIGGFSGNSVTAGVFGATIGGGGDSTKLNRVTDLYGTVGGGRDNQAGDGAGFTGDRDSATVGGGHLNVASGRHSTIGGGQANNATMEGSTVGGGGRNTASGRKSTVGGGDFNKASAFASTVPGGSVNQAGGWYSFAAGRLAKVRDNDPASIFYSGDADGDEGTFVWADSTGNSLVSTGPNQFLVRASGGMWFGTTIAASIPSGRFLNTSTGGYLSSTGVWTDSSDREAKENFQTLERREVLDRLAELPITRWNFKVQGPSVEHIGPTAQDFHAAFGTGEDDRHLAALDTAGVALAAIQGLYATVQEKECEIAELKATNARLEERLVRVEALLSLRQKEARPGRENQ